MKRQYLLLAGLVMLLILSGCSQSLPEGTLIKSSVSPNGKYQVNAYLCDGGATVDQAVRAEVVFIDTSETRNIYWQYHAYDAQIEWVSDELVTVNDITLNIFHDMYDYRKRRSNE